MYEGICQSMEIVCSCEIRGHLQSAWYLWFQYETRVIQLKTAWSGQEIGDQRNINLSINLWENGWIITDKNSQPFYYLVSLHVQHNNISHVISRHDLMTKCWHIHATVPETAKKYNCKSAITDRHTWTYTCVWELHWCFGFLLKI